MRPGKSTDRCGSMSPCPRSLAPCPQTPPPALRPTVPPGHPCNTGYPCRRTKALEFKKILWHQGTILFPALSFGPDILKGHGRGHGKQLLKAGSSLPAAPGKTCNTHTHIVCNTSHSKKEIIPLSQPHLKAAVYCARKRSCPLPLLQAEGTPYGTGRTDPGESGL